LLTYETILSTIRFHLSDPLMGTGKFSREELCADKLLQLIKDDRKKDMPTPQTGTVGQLSSLLRGSLPGQIQSQPQVVTVDQESPDSKG